MRTKSKAVRKILFTFILIVLTIFLISAFWWNNQLTPINTDKTLKAFVIAKGQGVSEIAEKLKEGGFIKSDLAFKIYARQNGIASKIQAGTFKLSSSQTTPEIAETLTKGALDLWVTLLEGWRLEEMAGEISKNFNDNSEEFVTNAKEGYMFPDTYLFPREVTGGYIATTMKNNFEKKYSPELRAKIKKQGLTEEEGVILASLVEREGRSDKVRTEIAGIMLKRLNMGMKLDLDATVQYAVGFQPSEKTWWKRHITRDDKAMQSPYNTYVSPGLPPAPICNPSLSSLNAVANANSNTPHIYYYHDSAGNSHYARTLDEHNENVANNP